MTVGTLSQFLLLLSHWALNGLGHWALGGLGTRCMGTRVLGIQSPHLIISHYRVFVTMTVGDPLDVGPPLVAAMTSLVGQDV